MEDSPQTTNDYRPISLLNYSVKLLTRLIVNRLQNVILQVIHTNQYGFIKRRSIQIAYPRHFNSCIFVSNQKKEIVILKLDFDKAFDKVEHQVILDMFHYKGFSEKWTKWIKCILQALLQYFSMKDPVNLLSAREEFDGCKV